MEATHIESDTPACYSGTMKNESNISLETGLATFMTALVGKNRSSATVRAYTTDLVQFFAYLRENDVTVTGGATVGRAHVTDYLAHLSQEHDLSGVTRARKLVAIREYFRFLVAEEFLLMSPAQKIEAPRQERKTRTRMRQDEYSRLLSIAGSSPRDFAILTVFLQCGIRVGELCALTISDIDLVAATLTVRSGKGMADREIELEKKAVKALRTYLKDRGDTASPALFLNRYGAPIGDRGIRKLIDRLCKEAGLEKKISPHIFRHTFASVKAESGKVSPFQLQQWLGHKDIKTTQIYVHMSKEYGRKAMEGTSL